MRVAMAADVSLAGTFAPELWKEGYAGRPIAWRSTHSARRKPGIDWNAVRAKVRSRFAKGAAVSVYALCRS